MGNFGPEYTDELYGGAYPGRPGAWRSGRGPDGYGWDYRTGGYARDYPPGGYGRDYRTGGHPGRGFGRRSTAYGYRGPGTDLGEDIARGYVSRWRVPRYGSDGEPGRPSWRKW